MEKCIDQHRWNSSRIRVRALPTSLWQNEELNKKAVEYVRDNVSLKGRPNLTTVTLILQVG